MGDVKLVAVYTRSYEPDHLVEGLLANLAPITDAVVEIDNRGRPWGHEGRLRARQRLAAIEAGADWVLVMDPDERLEQGAGQIIRPLLEERGNVIYRLALRELYTPTQYRVDGKWGLYRRGRLYPVRPGQVMSSKPIHAAPCPVNKDYRRVPVDVNLYHLKMIEAGNRTARVAAYGRAERDQRVRRRSWHTMLDQRGMRLETIPSGRGYTPAYRPYSARVAA